MTITSFLFSYDFVAFLDGLDDKRVEVITTALNDFAKGEKYLDPRSCEHFENRNKVLLHDANVVVYYDVKGDTMVMINGCEVQPRAS